jgi:hypothetical protein
MSRYLIAGEPSPAIFATELDFELAPATQDQ